MIEWFLPITPKPQNIIAKKTLNFALFSYQNGTKQFIEFPYFLDSSYNKILLTYGVICKISWVLQGYQLAKSKIFCSEIKSDYSEVIFATFLPKIKRNVTWQKL